MGGSGKGSCRPGLYKPYMVCANPINNYDVTFYLGKYSHFSDTITNQLGKYPLDFYPLVYDFDAARKVFPQAKEVLEFYEQAFGPFPFMADKYSLVESPYEGMENQGAIAFGSEFVKKDQGQMYLTGKTTTLLFMNRHMNGGAIR